MSRGPERLSAEEEAELAAALAASLRSFLEETGEGAPAGPSPQAPAGSDGVAGEPEPESVGSSTARAVPHPQVVYNTQVHFHVLPETFVRAHREGPGPTSAAGASSGAAAREPTVAPKAGRAAASSAGASVPPKAG